MAPTLKHGYVLSSIAALLLLSSTTWGGEPQSKANTTENRQFGTPVEGRVISIAADKDTYAPGEQITLSIVFKNVGKEGVRTMVSPPLEMYGLSVSFTHDQDVFMKIFGRRGPLELVPSDRKVPLTLYGKQCIEKLRGGSNSTPTLLPGDSIVSTIQLSRLFDMTLPGRYSILVRRTVWKDATCQETLQVTSNSLEVKVDESLGEPVQKNASSRKQAKGPEKVSGTVS